MPVDPIALHQTLVEHFDLEELRTLCFHLHVDYDNLRGEGKAAKARELVSFMERHDQLDELAAALKPQKETRTQVAPPPAVPQPVGPRQPKISTDEAEYKYDIFISYSHADKEWGQGELLPRLEKAGLRVCIDFRDFEIGVPSLVNMEQAVDNSRHTLIVLTPAWVKSEWTEFESLLAGTADPAGRRRKLIPLMLDKCQPPPRIAMLTYADFTEPAKREAEIARLIQSLKPMRVDTSSGSKSTANVNPFGDTGRITDPGRFFDREELLHQVFEELGKGVSLSLVGESQIGKSSLLSMICTLGPERLNLPPAAFVSLSLELVDGEGEFYEALCEGMRIEKCRGFPLSRTLRGKRYVLCLDEIEKMTWKGFTRNLRSQLRGLADGSDAPLTLAIASRSPLARLFPDSPELDSPLAGICHQLDVGPFAPDIARAFLAHRLRSTGVTFAESEIAALLDASGGHPAKLQRAAAELFRQHSPHNA